MDTRRLPTELFVEAVRRGLHLGRLDEPERGADVYVYMTEDSRLANGPWATCSERLEVVLTPFNRHRTVICVS